MKTAGRKGGEVSVVVVSAKVLEGNKKGFGASGKKFGPLPRPQIGRSGHGRTPFHDHNFKGVVVEGAYPSTTIVVVKDLRLDSYLHVMPPRFLSTTNIGFLVVNYGREKPIF